MRAPRHPRRLDWEDLLNARDLGGLPTGQGSTREGALVRTDSLARLTPAGQAAMLAYGVTTIVDLRCAREVAAAPSRVASHRGYRNLPFMDDESVGAPSRFETAGENYVDWLASHGSRVAAIVRMVAAAPPGCVLLHCAAGKDRTGVVVALLLSIAGVGREAIAEDYALSRWWSAGTREEEVAVAPDAEQRARDRRIYDPRPENILQMFEELDRRHGGVGPYLAAIGVGPDTLGLVRDRLS